MTSSSRITSVLRSSRREALFVAVVWILACGYTVGYSARFGYRTGEPLQLLFGIPAWVVWGVFAPWTVVTLITCWYAFAGIQDEELDEEPTRSGEIGDEVSRG